LRRCQRFRFSFFRCLCFDILFFRHLRSDPMFSFTSSLSGSILCVAYQVAIWNDWFSCRSVLI
jgi:hypothetical protein